MRRSDQVLAPVNRAGGAHAIAPSSRRSGLGRPRTFAYSCFSEELLLPKGGAGSTRKEGSLTALERASNRMLLCHVGSRLCGFPIEHIAETMRPLPVESLAGMPPFVLGLALIRGAPTPVVDLGALLHGSERRTPVTRYVTVKSGTRRAALAVGAVVGVRAVPRSIESGLPPLFGDVRNDFVESIGTLDGDLLLVLASGKIVPPSVWAAVDAREARS